MWLLRLHWPDGAPSKKSVKAVKKMSNLRRLILSNGDSSAVPYIDSLVDLLSGLLRCVAGLGRTAQLSCLLAAPQCSMGGGVLT